MSKFLQKKKPVSLREMGLLLRATYELLADAAEPQATIKVKVNAVDAHETLDAAPRAEGGITPLAFGILPMSSVGLFVRKGRIGFVDGGQRIRIGGFESAQFVFLFQFVIGDVATEVEENHFGFLSLAARHIGDYAFVGVLFPTSGVQNLSWCPTAIHFYVANQQITDRFDTITEHHKLLAGELGLSENRLHRIRTEIGSVLLEQGPVVGDGLYDLAVSHRL